MFLHTATSIAALFAMQIFDKKMKNDALSWLPSIRFFQDKQYKVNTQVKWR
jgi:hypothetical protein